MIALPDLVAALQQIVRGYGRHGEIYILAGDDNCAADMLSTLRKNLGHTLSRMTLPLLLFRLLASLGDVLRRWHLPAPWDSEQQARLFGDLRFDAGNAREALEWQPQYRFVDVADQLIGKTP